MAIVEALTIICLNTIYRCKYQFDFISKLVVNAYVPTVLPLARDKNILEIKDGLQIALDDDLSLSLTVHQVGSRD